MTISKRPFTKPIWKYIVLGATLLFSPSLLCMPSVILKANNPFKSSQDKQDNVFKETITKELRFPNSSSQNMLSINNITGRIDVQGYEGDVVKIKIEKIITASSDISLEKAIGEINIKTKESGNTFYTYLDSPYSEFDMMNKSLSLKNDCQGDSCFDYTFQLHYSVQVPQGTNLHLSTVNGGDITVKDLRSENIVLRHISGSIELENIAGATDASTVSGNINVSYSKNPTKESSYITTSGDIVLNLQEQLDANVSYEIQDGKIISDFEAERLRNYGLKIGKGNVYFYFKVLSGNVYLNKN